MEIRRQIGLAEVRSFLSRGLDPEQRERLLDRWRGFISWHEAMRHERDCAHIRSDLAFLRRVVRDGEDPLIAWTVTWLGEELQRHAEAAERLRETVSGMENPEDRDAVLRAASKFGEAWIRFDWM